MWKHDSDDSKMAVSMREAAKTCLVEGSSLHTPHFTSLSSHFALHTPHSKFTLDTPHCTPYNTPHFTPHTPSTLYTPHSTLYTPHFTLHIPHSTLYTPHFTLHTPHFTLHTLHSTLRTLHSHFTLHTPHVTLHIPHFTHLAPRSILYIHTLTLHSALHTPHFTLPTLHFALCTPHSILDTPHSTISSSHSTRYLPHLTLQFLHAQHLALQPLPLSTVCSALVQNLVSKPCFTKVFYVTAFGFVGFLSFLHTTAHPTCPCAFRLRHFHCKFLHKRALVEIVRKPCLRGPRMILYKSLTEDLVEILVVRACRSCTCHALHLLGCV